MKPTTLDDGAQSKTERIAALNDEARQGRDRTARIVFTTNLLDALGDGSGLGDLRAQARVMKAMRECAFGSGSPERDMAWFEVDGVKAMMKIDYYDRSFEWGSEDPTDASMTRRVITLMLPQDY